MSGVFISYRRADSAPWAGRLRDRLVSELPDRHVFFDIDNISLGVDFRKVIADTLAECDDVLLLIGPHWLERDADGVRRIDDEADLHRVEVESSLRSGARLIPILVGGASMPRADDLPSSLRELAFRNAHAIDHASFGRDVDVLVRALRHPGPPTTPIVPAPPAPTVATAPPPAPAAPTPASSLVQLPDRPSAGRRNLPIIVGALAALAAVVVGIVVLGGGDDGSNQTANPTTLPSTTSVVDLVVATAATTSSAVAPVDGVVLPAPESVYDQSVEEGIAALEAAGLVVEVDLSGCSNTVQPGRVRRVTVGSDLDVGIIYGKPGDEFDLEAAAGLAPGDLVTVWTPTTNPC